MTDKFDQVYAVGQWIEQGWWALILALLIGAGLQTLLIAGSLWLVERRKGR